MGYDFIRKTTPKARHEHACIWCPEKITKGETYVHVIGNFHGDFQDHHWHPECYDVATTYFQESGEDEFPPHECRRGSLEHC